MEWGSHRVPVLVPTGGDDESGEPGPNPRPEWSKETLTMIAEGRIKRVRFWEEETGRAETLSVQIPASDNVRPIVNRHNRLNQTTSRINDKRNIVV